MEEDRAQTDLGVAADLEAAEAPPVQRQPKKRFVGRRTANAARDAAPGASVEDSGAIQGKSIYLTLPDAPPLEC